MVSPWQSASVTQQDIVKEGKNMGAVKVHQQLEARHWLAGVKCYMFDTTWNTNTVQKKKKKNKQTNKQEFDTQYIAVDGPQVCLPGCIQKTQVEYLCSPEKSPTKNSHLALVGVTYTDIITRDWVSTPLWCPTVLWHIRKQMCEYYMHVQCVPEVSASSTEICVYSISCDSCLVFYLVLCLS